MFLTEGSFQVIGGQPGLAHAAADELLNWLGFSNVVRAQDEAVTSSSPDAVTGYVLTRAADL
jgi:hypothetical protein